MTFRLNVIFVYLSDDTFEIAPHDNGANDTNGHKQDYQVECTSLSLVNTLTHKTNAPYLWIIASNHFTIGNLIRRINNIPLASVNVICMTGKYCYIHHNLL